MNVSQYIFVVNLILILNFNHGELQNSAFSPVTLRHILHKWHMFRLYCIYIILYYIIVQYSDNNMMFIMSLAGALQDPDSWVFACQNWHAKLWTLPESLVVYLTHGKPSMYFSHSWWHFKIALIQIKAYTKQCWSQHNGFLMHFSKCNVVQLSGRQEQLSPLRVQSGAERWDTECSRFVGSSTPDSAGRLCIFETRVRVRESVAISWLCVASSSSYQIIRGSKERRT